MLILWLTPFFNKRNQRNLQESLSLELAQELQDILEVDLVGEEGRNIQQNTHNRCVSKGHKGPSEKDPLAKATTI